MYEALAKKVLFPLGERSRGAGISRRLKELEKSQWYKPEEISKMQERKLKALIHHAYEHVPYYHDIMKKGGIKPDDIKEIKDLGKLPLLRKEDIKENWPDRIVAKNLGEKDRLSRYSSGSTGEPMAYYVDRNTNAFNWASIVRWWQWGGYDFGKRHATLWGNPQIVLQHSKLGKKLSNMVVRNLFLAGNDMAPETMDLYTVQLRKFRPVIIYSYASSMYLQAKHLKEKGIRLDDIGLTSVLTSGETLYNSWRELIEDRFGVPVLDGYGNEAVPPVCECMDRCGYHITAEGAVIEYLREGEPVADGERGEIVVTNLNNFVNPFIRYGTGDIGIPTSELCTCGRGLPLMKAIEGRITDIPVTPSGKFLIVHWFTFFFEHFDSIDKFQVYQKVPEEIVFRLVKNEKFDDGVMKALEKGLTDYIGEDVNLVFEFVEDIPPVRSGKRRFVISEVNPFH